MASVQDLSVLSQLAYNENGGPVPEVPLPAGWSVLTFTSDVSETVDGYFGVAYINEITNEIVISSRGSQSTIEDWRQNASAFFGRTVNQFSAAKLFAERVIAGAPNSEIAFTGHSLGGGLANMLAVHFVSYRAVAFNSIGVKESLATLGYNVNADYSNIVTNISAWFDPASLVGTRIGTDKRIAVSSIPLVPDIFEPILAIIGALKFSALGTFLLAAYQTSQHSMANLARTLSSLSGVDISGVAPDLLITESGQLTGGLTGELASLEAAIAQDTSRTLVLPPTASSVEQMRTTPPSARAARTCY